MPEEEIELELEFLRFFYDKAGEAFGPADSDVYHAIIKDFEQLRGVSVPKAYRQDEEEE